MPLIVDIFAVTSTMRNSFVHFDILDTGSDPITVWMCHISLLASQTLALSKLGDGPHLIKFAIHPTTWSPMNSFVLQPVGKAFPFFTLDRRLCID